MQSSRVQDTVMEKFMSSFYISKVSFPGENQHLGMMVKENGCIPLYSR